MLLEIYNIEVNGYRIHHHERNTELTLGNSAIHPLKYFKTWINTSEFLLEENANLKLTYLRQTFKTGDEDLSYKNVIQDYFIQDFFSIKLGCNKYMEEQDLWLVSNKADVVKTWQIIFEDDIGLQSLICHSHENSIQRKRVGLGFVAEREYLTVEECDALLAFCNARTMAINIGREQYN